MSSLHDISARQSYVAKIQAGLLAFSKEPFIDFTVLNHIGHYVQVFNLW